MGKAFLDKCSDNVVCSRLIINSACKEISPRYDFAACDFHQSNSLRVARLEPSCCARGDVEALSVGLSAVEDECGIRLDEVVMRSNLLMKPVQKSMLHSEGDGGHEALWLLASAN